MTEALDLSHAPIMLEFSVGATGPPSLERLTDGRAVFKVHAAGTITGRIEGTMTSAITEVNPAAGRVYQSISVLFKVETEQGAFEGFYAGSIDPPTSADVAHIRAHGRILFVTGGYADLYLAEVFVTSQVHFVEGRSTGETGTMTLAPR